MIVLSLALDPFFQQLVTFPAQLVPQGNGTIAMALTYSPDKAEIYQNGSRTNVNDQTLQNAAEPYFFGSGISPGVPGGTGDKPNIPLSCPTSNCTWEPYDSLAVCSTCADVTEYLEFTCFTGRIDWLRNLSSIGTEATYPNATACGYFLNATSSAPVLMSGYVVNPQTGAPGEALHMRMLPLSGPLTKPQPLYGGSLMFKDWSLPIADFIVASTEQAGDIYANRTPVAHECIMSWCVKTFQSSYSGDRYTEDVVDTVRNTTYIPNPYLFTPTGGHYLNSIQITPQRRNTSTVYTVSNATMANAVAVFMEILPAYSTFANISAPSMLRYYNAKTPYPFTRPLLDSPWLPSTNLTLHMENMAKAMTDAVRSESASNDLFEGQALVSIIVVHVSWEWLALPLTLLFASLIFLLATIVKSSQERQQVGIWKNSAMATLLNGLPDEVQRKITAATKIGTPRAKAKNLKVRLLPNKDGWRMSSHVLSPHAVEHPREKPPTM